MNKLSISLVASLSLATNLFSAQDLEPITITSSSIKSDEKNATFATEIYTKKDIEESKSKDIYDFLSSQSSINIAPSYGNTFSQKIDLRGYGLGDGYQNIVVLVNGRKMNNIDMSSQLLSSIPLESIEKIEILKGTGSVSYGDGANAGVINIITNSKNENYVKTYFGNNGVKNGTLSLGYSNDTIILNAYTDYSSTNGTRVDASNDKDENYNKNKKISVIYFPTEDLELRLSRNYSNMNIKYAGSLTLQEFNENPNLASSFTEQYFRSYVTTGGVKYDLNSDLSLDINYNEEDKLSRYSSGWASNYDYKSFSSKLNYEKNSLKLAIGFDGFNGDRISSSDTTNKTNKAVFVSSEYLITDNLNVSAGFRRENIEYNYNSLTTSTKYSDYLNAYDLGINYKINEDSSIFANYNRSFQTPDIDRFFEYGTGQFTGFIEPAKVRNYNLGYSNIQKNNKLKITVFKADLKNEIYLYSVNGYKNTNIDKSYKYGLEVFDKYLINDNLFTSINYSYIIAKIDEENENNGAYNGKYLPGVSKHNLTLNLGYSINKINTVLSHTYRNSAYAANDFENNFTQKQKAYNSTDFNISYNYKNIELFGKIQNLFDRRNGIWVRDDAIYPVNFERTYYAGMKVKF